MCLKGCFTGGGKGNVFIVPSREGNMVVTLPSLMLLASAFRAAGEESRMGGNYRRKRTKLK